MAEGYKCNDVGLFEENSVRSIGIWIIMLSVLLRREVEASEFHGKILKNFVVSLSSLIQLVLLWIKASPTK